MNARLRGPIAALVLAVTALLVAMLLDRGSEASRDAALLLGSVALYVMLPVALVWLAVALLRQRSAGRR